MELEQVAVQLRAAYESGVTRSFTWRQAQLKALLKLLYDNEKEIALALQQDLGKHHVEAYRDEVGFLVKSARNALDNLKKWMAPTKAYIPLVAIPRSGMVVPEPLGLVLIFSSWNFPIVLSLEPLLGAISSGNAVVLKPSELAPAASNFLAETIPKYLDNQIVKVIQGGHNIGEQLLEMKWDKIFFTGSPRVGRIVMTAAAKHLTPVILELGGKCPAIFDSSLSSRSTKIAVQRVLDGRCGACGGQACIGIDYLLVEEKFAPILIELLKTEIKKRYGNPGSMSRIVNNHHFQRLNSLLKDPSVASTIVFGGSADPEKLYIEPTILLDPPLDTAIMTEEIFGPLLPIITLKKIEDSIKFIRARPKPLVIYAFTDDEKLKNRIIEETSSGSVTINDSLVQYACETLPFGGVGSSGFGAYHGKYSFDAFTHYKAVLKRGFLLEFECRYPPWDNQKLELLKAVYHFNYIRFALGLLGFKT